MKLLLQTCFMAGVAWVLGLGSTFPVNGQIVNDGQVIYLTSGALLVAGDIHNQAGSITNVGEIRLTGNWTNKPLDPLLAEARYAGSGTLHLAGTNLQKIDHNGQRIAVLIAKNGPKQLSSNLIITSDLQLINSIITTDTNRLLLQRPGINDAFPTLSEFSSTSYIDGTLYWASTDVRIYPIGKNGVYTPLMLSSEPAKPGSEPIVGMRLIDPPASPVKPDTSINRLSVRRYWERIVLQGTSEQAYITLPILPDEGIVSMDSVVVAGTDSLTKPFYSLGRGAVTGTPDNGTITSKRYATTRFLALAEPIRGELLYLPNAFAPASFHPEEQVFKVYGTTLSPTGIQLDIYNRWGNLIYSSRSLEEIAGQGWNGQNQKTHQEEISGVYTYVLQGKFTTGKPFRRTGTITLIR